MYVGFRRRGDENLLRGNVLKLFIVYMKEKGKKEKEREKKLEEKKWGEVCSYLSCSWIGNC